MKTTWILVASLAVLTAVPAFAEGEQQQPPYDIRRGDTLWDLSGRFSNEPKTWPKLWSQNPQIHNPHWVFPGDLLFPKAGGEAAQAAEPEMHEIRLVLEKVEPPPPPPPPKPVVEEVKEEAAAVAKKPVETSKAIKLAERYAQDFISPERVRRLGDVDNRRVVKIISGDPEEVEITLRDGAKLRNGDQVTLVDDSREVFHPVTGKSAGYHVRVLAQAEVLDAEGSRARAKVLRSYDTVLDGNGVIPYRKPILSVEKAKGLAGVKGVVLTGRELHDMFSADTAVFLDKGRADGLVPGAVLDIPYPDGPEIAEGITTRMDLPIARGVVVSTEEKTSLFYILESRKAVRVGHPVVASADSP